MLSARRNADLRILLSERENATGLREILTGQRLSSASRLRSGLRAAGLTRSSRTRRGGVSRGFDGQDDFADGDGGHGGVGVLEFCAGWLRDASTDEIEAGLNAEILRRLSVASG